MKENLKKCSCCILTFLFIFYLFYFLLTFLFIIIFQCIISGRSYSTYTQKLPKLDPPPPCTQTYAFDWTPPPPPLPFMSTYFLYIHSSSPIPLPINFYSVSSFCHSQFLGYFHFYLSLRLNFTKPISKRFLWFLFIG